MPCSEIPDPPTGGSAVPPIPDVPPTQVLVYGLADGRQMVIQAPVSLGWDTDRLVRFAEGVEVLPAAEGGRG